MLTREILLDVVRRNYPGLEPRNDFDIVELATERHEGTPVEVYAWLDNHFAEEVQSMGSYEKVMYNAAKLLDTYVEPTGLPVIFIRPIPDSEYSIRLFPDSISAAEYRMDFVETATGKAVNSPFEFELWGVPNPDTPHITMAMTGQLRSIERAHSIKQKYIDPGEERFILRGGQSCLSQRPGKIPVLFTVPSRKHEEVTASHELRLLDLPKVVSC
ncbi:hypothetical protein C8Q77DRAFT_1152083 [Trametes polyzona]|nr:hypothetical protein C8Q77DRAFT_1152083 [Trametes polyzona]